MKILTRFCLETFLKINILYKNNDYSYTFAMGDLAPGEMFDNILQLMRFSVYFEGVLNTSNGYLHIKNNDISGTHARGLLSRFPPRKFGKKCILVRFDVSLHTILGPPQTSFFACYMRSHSGPFLSIL